ncbi:hypothetical protein ABH925_006086, partial [Streptacidiphilus sp. EB129]
MSPSRAKASLNNLNEHFASAKVDREERPDVDAVYMEAVQASRRAGWAADDSVPDAREGAVLLRDVLPGRAPARYARLPTGGGRRWPGSAAASTTSAVAAAAAPPLGELPTPGGGFACAPNADILDPPTCRPAEGSYYALLTPEQLAAALPALVAVMVAVAVTPSSPRASNPTRSSSTRGSPTALTTPSQARATLVTLLGTTTRPSSADCTRHSRSCPLEWCNGRMPTVMRWAVVRRGCAGRGRS